MLDLDPTNANAYFNRGSTYDSMGLYDKAIADYTRALEIDRDVSASAGSTTRARTDSTMTGGTSSIGEHLYMYMCAPVARIGGSVRDCLVVWFAATAALAAVNAARTRKLQAGK